LGDIAARYETLEDLKKFARPSVGDDRFKMPGFEDARKPEAPSRGLKKRDDDSSDDDEDADAESEAAFKRELDDVKEQFEQDRKARPLNPSARKIAVPIELLTADPPKTMPKMTALAPPAEFTVIVPKGNKSETITFPIRSTPSPE
jgi:hypothetical protein